MRPPTPTLSVGLLAATLLAATSWLAFAPPQLARLVARASSPLPHPAPHATDTSHLRDPDPSARVAQAPPAVDPPDSEDEPTIAIGVGSGGAGASFSFRCTKRHRRGRPEASGPHASVGEVQEQEEEAGPAPTPATGGAPLDPLAALVAAQREDGRWAVEDLASTPPHEPPCPCAAPEHELGDVGLTSLVLLTLLDQGSTSRHGPHKEAVALAAYWLMYRQQDAENGLIGPRAQQGWLYDHALATVTLGELLQAAWSPITVRHYTGALRALERARLPGSAWGARTEAAEREDVFVTAWAATALGLAPSVHPADWLEIDASYRQDVLEWLDSVTDPETGEVAGSHRVQVRAATAAALWTRIQLGGTADDDPALARGLDSLLERRLMFREDPLGCELRGPLLGSLAAYCAGDGKAWSRWRSLLKVALTDSVGEPARDVRALTTTALGASVHYRYLRVLVR